MIDSLTLIIVLLGTATVVLSIFVAFKFRQHAQSMDGDGMRLSTALCFQLAGEAILGVGTLAFAVLAYLGMLPHVPIQVQSILRLIMFVASSFTTVHLYMVTSRIHSKK